MTSYVLALDAGTTSNRAIVFDLKGRMVAAGQRPLQQSWPQDGWVEHDPDAIWQGICESAREALRRAEISARQLLAVGIANQRETTICWDRASGQPIYPAVVWQDRRTAEHCEQLSEQGLDQLAHSRCGLLPDAYFCASKIAWILRNVPGAAEQAAQGRLCFGTVDSWLVWKLTGGRHHCTDATNASRTLLFDIHKQAWDDELLALFEVPRAMLPEVLDSAPQGLTTEAEWLGAAVPLTGIAGDQQAALVGQACIRPGMLKSTYGTGGFLMLNTGEQAIPSHNRLLTTVAYRISGQTTYALEGSIFNVGTAIQWLRDELRQFADPAETAELAAQASPDSSVMLVPAFTGLGAPYWDADARGLISGLTRDSGIPELVRAALEAAMFQTRDLVGAMQQDGQSLLALRVDGGMVANDWFCQCLADGLQLPVERPAVIETTALGAAMLAMLGAAEVANLAELSGVWRQQDSFRPQSSAVEANDRYALWRHAVKRARLQL